MNLLTSTTVETNSLLRPLRRSGDSSLRGIRIPYPGMDRVVETIQGMIEQYRGEEFIREKALAISKSVETDSRTGMPNMRNFDGIATKIYDWIVANIHYVRDQNHIERLQTPDATLQLKTGDCDDMVILAGSLLESVGIPTQIRLLGNSPGDFNHIYLDYFNGSEWKSFDPTLALYPGYTFNQDAIAAEKTISIPRPKPQPMVKTVSRLKKRGSSFVY